MGKASFFAIQDKEGFIQIYIRKDIVGEDQYNLFKMADIGDIVGINGHVMRTQTGEITIKCTKYTHLVKALRPLPEKFHGLQDVEERYRRRYLDLIMNEDAKRVAIQRPRIIRAMQEYFDSHDLSRLKHLFFKTFKVELLLVLSLLIIMHLMQTSTYVLQRNYI